MQMLDLFSGIGGFSLAASWVWGDELEIVGFCEIDKYCQKVLNKHWPDVPIYPDIKKLKGNQFDSVELITGGFPCQPYSVAGKRKGKEDDRALWPEMFRIIKETKPRWIIAENTPGIINLGLKNIIADLESEKYKWEIFWIPAIALNARHFRERVWITAYSNSFTSLQKNSENVSNRKTKRAWRCIASENWRNVPGIDWNVLPPRICRKNNGIPNRVDRLKSLGNAIVPQVVAVIMQAIKEISNEK